MLTITDCVTHATQVHRRCADTPPPNSRTASRAVCQGRIKTIIPDTREHLFTPTNLPNTYPFGGFGLSTTASSLYHPVKQMGD